MYTMNTKMIDTACRENPSVLVSWYMMGWISKYIYYSPLYTIPVMRALLKSIRDHKGNIKHPHLSLIDTETTDIDGSVSKTELPFQAYGSTFSLLAKKLPKKPKGMTVSQRERWGRELIEEDPNQVIPWFIMAVIAYEIAEDFVSDGFFDTFSERMLKDWKTLQHPFKRFIDPHGLNKGSSTMLDHDELTGGYHWLLTDLFRYVQCLSVKDVPFQITKQPELDL